MNLQFIQNLEIGMSKTSNKAKKRAKAADNAKSKKQIVYIDNTQR